MKYFFNPSSQVKRLRDVGGRYEVVLEHAMYLLMIGKINDASNCIKVRISPAIANQDNTGNVLLRGLPFSTYALGGWVGSSLPYISIAYYMLKRGRWVQIACKIAYILLKGRPLSCTFLIYFNDLFIYLKRIY